MFFISALLLSSSLKRWPNVQLLLPAWSATMETPAKLSGATGHQLPRTERPRNGMSFISRPKTTTKTEQRKTI